MDTFKGIYSNLFKLWAQAHLIPTTVFTLLKDFLKITSQLRARLFQSMLFSRTEC